MPSSLLNLPHPLLHHSGGIAPLRARFEFVPVGATHPRTRDHVHARTRELAVLAGRDPLDVKQADYEQAKREVTGEAEPDRQLAMLDAAPWRETRPPALSGVHDPTDATVPSPRSRS